jgi:hypothetical protein
MAYQFLANETSKWILLRKKYIYLKSIHIFERENDWANIY